MPTALLLASAPPETALRTLHCQGCGRRLLRYAALGRSAILSVRCRDCKTSNTLRGADVMALLGALSQGGDER